MSNIIDPAFAARLQEYGHCDFLIDRMSGFPLQEELAALEGQAETLPLNDPLFAAMPDQAPLLVRLPADATDLIEGYLACAAEEAQCPGQAQAICAVLFSRLPFAKLARHLTRHLDLRIKTGKRVYFRYYDPRVMHHLPQILQPEEMAQLFKGIDHWCYQHWHSQRITLHAQDYGPLPDVPAYVRMSISSAQWKKLQDVEPFNLALQTLQQEGIALDGDTEPALRTALSVVDIYEGVHQLSVSDKVAFVCHVVRYGRTRQSIWHNALLLASEHAIPLQETLELSESALASLVAQLPTQK